MPVPPQPEVASDHAWLKSSYSGGNMTECVEAVPVPAGVLIRDSMRPEGPYVAVSAEAWARFIASSLSQ